MAVVKRLPVLHYSADYFFYISFGITELILVTENPVLEGAYIASQTTSLYINRFPNIVLFLNATFQISSLSGCYISATNGRQMAKLMDRLIIMYTKTNMPGHTSLDTSI